MLKKQILILLILVAFVIPIIVAIYNLGEVTAFFAVIPMLVAMAIAWFTETKSIFSAIVTLFLGVFIGWILVATLNPYILFATIVQVIVFYLLSLAPKL